MAVKRASTVLLRVALAGLLDLKNFLDFAPLQGEIASYFSSLGEDREYLL